MKDNIVLQTDFIGPCNLEQIGGLKDYEAFKCIIERILLPENSYCLNIETEWS